jgi:iron complex transport system substrate-binding protein
VDRHRRAFLLGSAATVLLAACGSDDDGDAAASPSPGGTDGRWTHTDDVGETVELERAPERIAAYIGSAAVLWDFGIRAAGVFGPQRQADGSAAPSTGLVDLDAVTSLGEEEVDLEQLAALRPDLIVLQAGPTGLDTWPITEEQLDEVRSIAPFVAVQAYGAPASDILAAYERLAVALGADVDGPDVGAARDDLAAATAELRDVLAGKDGLVAMFTYADTDGLWVANVANFPDVLEYRRLGLDVVEAGAPDDYFQMLSWEEADRYPVDVILHDERPTSLQPDELAALYPTWSALPAVRAGQVGRWNAETVLSHRGLAAAVTDLAATLRGARTDVV